MVLYMIFPANIFSILYEFNPESFAPPLLFWMFMAFQKQRWMSFFMASIILMSIKENMPLVVCAFGIYGLFKKDCPKSVAGGALLLGAIFFYILALVVVPYYSHLTYHPFVGRYVIWAIISGKLFFNSVHATPNDFKPVFSRSNGHFILDLFGPLLVPAWFSWRVFVFGVSCLFAAFAFC